MVLLSIAPLSQALLIRSTLPCLSLSSYLASHLLLFPICITSFPPFHLTWYPMGLLPVIQYFTANSRWSPVSRGALARRALHCHTAIPLTAALVDSLQSLPVNSWQCTTVIAFVAPFHMSVLTNKPNMFITKNIRSTKPTWSACY